MSSVAERSSAVILAALTLTALLGTFTALFQQVSAQSTPASPASAFYDLNYVAPNLKGLNGTAIATRGLAKFLGSIFMFEDFWLQDEVNQSARIPVVVRFAGLTVPQNGSLVEVAGTIKFSGLEGGFFYLNASSLKDVKNVIMIGWDGVQRNHLFDLLNSGRLPNLQAFINQGTMVNLSISDHATDTKSGWTQILTGYRWWKTGVFSNYYWFHSIPSGYTIPERVENYFGSSKIDTAFIVGKLAHMEIQDGTGDTVNGRFTRQAIYDNLPSSVDVCSNGNRNVSVIGPAAIQFLNNHANSHFFAFFHFSDPDHAGHNPQGGENSVMYEMAIGGCDFWLGQILNRLNTLNLTQKTQVYLTVDHGFDEGSFQHLNAPDVILATNDKSVVRDGDQVDVAPTIYYGLGMWGDSFEPALDGYPLQLSLPAGVEERRQAILADTTKPPQPTITSPSAGVNVNETVNVAFKASDMNLKTVLLLVNNTLVADGPWMWQQNETIRAIGSYSWNATGSPPGTYVISVLAFDEHGANNGPGVSSVTVDLATIPETPTSLGAVLILIILSLSAVGTKRKLKSGGQIDSRRSAMRV